MRRQFLITGLASLGGLFVTTNATQKNKLSPRADKVVKTEAEWQKLLTKEQYYVTRQKGTERAFTGKYWNNHAAGIYRCAACGLELFSSSTSPHKSHLIIVIFPENDPGKRVETSDIPKNPHNMA